MNRLASLIGVGFSVVMAMAPLVAGQDAGGPPQPMQDPALNNLVHPEGYQPCAPGSVASIRVAGRGPQALVLIPGWGFDGDIFAPIIDDQSERYTYITITPAGYAGSAAPAMPAGVSYGERSWWSDYEKAVWKEIEQRKLRKPILIAYLDGVQSALKIAEAHPEAIAGVISIVGLPQMEFQAPLPPAMRPTIMDQQMAQGWFKTVTRQMWNYGMGGPGWYAEDAGVGMLWYDKSLLTPIPTMVRYYCEHWSTDMVSTADRIPCPVLAILPDEAQGKDVPMYHEFLERALIKPWQTMSKANSKITLRPLSGARMGAIETHANPIRVAIDEFTSAQSDPAGP